MYRASIPVATLVKDFAGRLAALLDLRLSQCLAK